MKKFVLGAGLSALGLFGAGADHALAQSVPVQSPAPVVTAAPSATGADILIPDTAGATGSLVTGGSYADYIGTGRPAPAARFYTEASYLLMFFSGGNDIPGPIATGGPAQGIVGQQGTTVIIPGGEIDYDTASGIKIAAGGLVNDTNVGLEANGFYLGHTNDGRSVGPTGASVLARPFFDTVSGQETAKILASPGAFVGGITFNASASAWGAELNPFFRLVQGSAVSLDVITGFRYLGFEESIDIFDRTQVLAGGVTAFNGLGLGQGAVVTVRDRFSGNNQFYGGNIGARLSFSRGTGFFVDATAKIALGGIRQIVTADGTTTLLGGGGLTGVTTTPGGFLANPGTASSRSDNRFAVVPEGNLQLGYQFTSWLNVFGGYQVIYVSNVARPGEQINRNLNINQIPTVVNFTNRGSAIRGLREGDDDLFIHGFNVGLTITY